MSYRAPLQDMLFNIRHLANIEQIAEQIDMFHFSRVFWDNIFTGT